MGDVIIVEKVLNNLKMKFSSDAVSPTKFVITIWGQDKCSKGSCSFRSADRDFDDVTENLSRNVDKKVFFSGEHTSKSSRTGRANGTYETVETAGKAMEKIISGKVLEKEFCDRKIKYS